MYAMWMYMNVHFEKSWYGQCESTQTEFCSVYVWGKKIFLLVGLHINVVDHCYGGGQDIIIKTLSMHAHGLFTSSHFAPSVSKTKSFDLWKI